MFSGGDDKSSQGPQEGREVAKWCSCRHSGKTERGQIKSFEHFK